MPSIYIARPIDLSKLSPDQQTQISDAKQILVTQGWVIYEPARAWTIGDGAEVTSVVQNANNKVLDMVDALLAFWPELPGIGVSMEIQRAANRGIATKVVTLPETVSWALAGTRARQGPDFDAVDEHLLRSDLDYNPVSAPVFEMLPVKIDGGRMPSRGYTDDAGLDLYVAEDTIVPADGFADVPCGISVQLPPGVWGMITGRSSTLRKHNLLVSTGIIDSGYRGPLFAGIKNLGEQDFEAKTGMRLAQLIPLPNLARGISPYEVSELDPSDRGDAGFGSSGL